MSGDGITIRSLHFAIGSFQLRDIDLSVGDGEYFVLSGQNGSGKTLLMKLICGLHTPDKGEILIKGKPVTHVPPWKRGVGYVPQDGLLLPNRTVRGNIIFPLEVRKFPRRQRNNEVEKISDLLGISNLLDRRTNGLSGGERQKTAIARALVFRPKVLLLDEPVSAIDEQNRDAVCMEFKNLQKEISVTTIHVSHNSRETKLVADRVGKMTGDGRIELE